MKKIIVILLLICNLFCFAGYVEEKVNSNNPPLLENTWEDDFMNYDLKSEDKQILLTCIPDMNKCKSIERVAIATFKVNIDIKSYYITFYTSGENTGHIAIVTTGEENYEDRIKLYPIENPNPETIYENLDLNILAETWFFSNDILATSSEYKGKYIEFDMSCYVYDWFASIQDDRLFSANIYDNSWLNNKYLQIKFTSTADVQKIKNANLGWDKIIIKGEILSFNLNGILIKGIEIVKIIPFE